MNQRPQLWMLVGGNGAGKSTFYQEFIGPLGIPFVNADQYARQLWPANPEKYSYEAAKIAERERARQLELGATFCFETVFSHPSKIDFIAQAKAQGYEIKLFYFHLESPSLNEARVSMRVAAGGHHVPKDKIWSRLPRTYQNVITCLGLVDELHLFDNSSAEEPFTPVASWADLQWELFESPLPEWAMPIVEP